MSPFATSSGLPHVRRRRLRYSMRTLLLQVTGLCVVLSLWVVPAERQRRAMRVIVDEGCKPGTLMMAFYDNKSIRGPVLNESYFVHVTGIFLYDNVCGTEQLTDDRLARIGTQLPALPKLRSLYVSCGNVTDAGIEHLPRLEGIENLALDGTQLTDRGLIRLGTFDGLRHLNLGQTEITDDGLAHLYGLKNLERLDLSGTEVTASGCESLRRALPNCRIER